MIKREYLRLRAKGFAAHYALHCAKVADRFDSAQFEGLVRFTVVPDNGPYEHGDMGNEEETNARIDQEGLWGIMSEVSCDECGAWRTIDSCWGFIGLDWVDSGYDTDVKEAALDALPL